ncbi:MAG: hypothetical protein Kow00122_01970 [Thermoleophilia bacterium]
MHGGSLSVSQDTFKGRLMVAPAGAREKGSGSPCGAIPPNNRNALVLLGTSARRGRSRPAIHPSNRSASCYSAPIPW